MTSKPERRIFKERDLEISIAAKLTYHHYCPLRNQQMQGPRSNIRQALLGVEI